MKMALPTKEDLSGRRFGRLVVLKRSDQRASRGNRRTQGGRENLFWRIPHAYRGNSKKIDSLALR